MRQNEITYVNCQQVLLLSHWVAGPSSWGPVYPQDSRQPNPLPHDLASSLCSCLPPSIRVPRVGIIKSMSSRLLLALLPFSFFIPQGCFIGHSFIHSFTCLFTHISARHSLGNRSPVVSKRDITPAFMESLVSTIISKTQLNL